MIIRKPIDVLIKYINSIDDKIIRKDYSMLNIKVYYCQFQY